MRYRMLTFLVAAMACLSVTEQALACTCSASPMLSPTRMNLTTVDATVVRYLGEGGQGPELEGSMEVAVSRVFQGEVSSDTVVVYVGKADGLSCIQDVRNYPIGSRWLLSFGSSSSEPQSAIVPICSLHPAIIDDQIETRISDYSCTDPYSGCAAPRETLTLDQYDEIQRPYFAGARQAAGYITDKNLKTAARFIVEDEILMLPYLRIFNSQRDMRARSAKPPIAELNVTLKLVEGSGGQFLFDLKYGGPAAPQPR